MGASRSAPAVWLRGTGDSWDSRRGAMQGSRANAPNDAKAQDERRVPAARLGMMSCHRVPLPSRRTLGGPCDQRSALACDPPPPTSHSSPPPCKSRCLADHPPHQNPGIQHLSSKTRHGSIHRRRREFPSRGPLTSPSSTSWLLEPRLFRTGFVPADARHISILAAGPRRRGATTRKPNPPCGTTWRWEEAPAGPRISASWPGAAHWTNLSAFFRAGGFFFFIWDCRLVKVVGLVDMLGDKSD